jgi:predicted glycogen debranching enzyme
MLGRDVCGQWADATEHEWLVTNGLGGYACGTVAGANTRRYHGFLTASFKPPVERTLLVAKVDVEAHYLGQTYALFANEFEGGTVDPRGFVHLESFAVRNGIPVWRYALADAVLEQTIFMAPGANTSYLRLDVVRASAPLRLALKPLVTYRDYHGHSQGARPFRATAATTPGQPGCRIDAFEGAKPFRLAASAGTFVADDVWYWNFWHREEAARGLDALEDLWGPGVFSAEVAAGSALVFTASSEEGEPAKSGEILTRLVGHSQRLIAALPKDSPSWIRTLATASDQFVVRRGAKGAVTASIIAGYPWFTDWGRDTMISLPGLTTSLGRYDTAEAILRTYAGFVDGGMLPNRFSDSGETLEYNTADATLWMFHALNEHLEAKRDPVLLRDLFPTLSAIIHAHVDGTRYGIQVDPLDGLLRAGEPGLQLTWMDAKHGDQVFTPRIGKPVELNALWLNALEFMVRFAGRLRDAEQKRFCETLLAKASASFSRFWNEERSCLYDVLDVPGGNGSDSSIRPNQIFAVSLPYCVLSPQRMHAVVDTCARELLTSHGLRSLSPADPAYVGSYSGDTWHRDAAYHQGTVWSWLLGPFARAHYRVYRDAALAQSFLAPMAQHLAAACVGSVSEIFDGDAPHTARGCFAQAWSVAEILRTWISLERTISKS